ncbi:RhtB family transporter [Novosphingobium sp. Rr 2-17]|uniref:LysE family translocator n=1 Tax=Novosphingobium sp. Rr 2-17 TaxID=555793 RepID=UPI0002698EE0|nr:LysE family transporter [Novosphingobium sp. Rr 2-17]EIZ79294.1 RhtB family transporter [Novosphingobium sp. Rr 2-17]
MDQLPLIFGITLLAVVSPGADFAMISRNSFLYGRRAGVLAAVGIGISCWFHVFYAIFGLAIIQRLFPHILDVIKIAGAGYLIYVGATTALARAKTVGADDVPGGQTAVRAITAGILTNGLNPKTAVFVISLYTQIIGPGRSIAFQLGCGLFISLAHLIWFAGVASFLSQPAIRLKVLANQRVFNGLIGAVLVMLGIALVLFDVSQSSLL